MNGYTGRLLLVDLGTRAVVEERIDPDVLRRFIGGVGLATWLLYRTCPAGAEPLGPENPLIFATSPLVGTQVTTSAKFAVVAKSPLTGFIGDSLSSSFLALELKRAGLDAIVIHGRAAEPTWIAIDNGAVSFHPAAHLMGLSPTETGQVLRDEVGDPHLRVAAIGVAGERLVRFATIGNDGRHAGRTGTGAVMGSKNLKAIAVRGRQAVRVAHPARLREVNAALVARSRGPATAKYRHLGTPANLLVFDRLGVLPTRNFQRGTFAAAENLSGEALHERYLAKVVGCASCTVGCEHLYRSLEPGPDGEPILVRLEYESVFALGSLLGIADPSLVIEAAARCDALGVDSISAGGTIAWAMECFERGLIGPSETDGLDLRFGNGAVLLPILDRIARREGIGDLLAEGSRRAADRLGRGSAAWAMHVKGLELPGYEPRGLKTMALGFAVSTRGACHNRVPGYEADFSSRVDRLRADVERGRLAADGEDFAAVLDSLVLCKFIRNCFDDFYAEAANLYQLVTGWEMTPDELRRSGERITTLKKLFNVREGWTRADDDLPPRLLAESLPDGVAAGTRLTRAELDLMIAGYYEARGWTSEGQVPPERIAALDLADIVGEVMPLTGRPANPLSSG